MNVKDIIFMLGGLEKDLDIPGRLRAVLAHDQPVIKVDITATIMLHGVEGKNGDIPIVLYFHKDRKEEEWRPEFIPTDVANLVLSAKQRFEDAKRDKFIKCEGWAMDDDFIEGTTYKFDEVEWVTE